MSGKRLFHKQLSGLGRDPGIAVIRFDQTAHISASLPAQNLDDSRGFKTFFQTAVELFPIVVFALDQCLAVFSLEAFPSL